MFGIISDGDTSLFVIVLYVWLGTDIHLGRLAQLEERFPYKEEVTGSRPVPPIGVEAANQVRFSSGVARGTPRLRVHIAPARRRR